MSPNSWKLLGSSGGGRGPNSGWIIEVMNREDLTGSPLWKRKIIRGFCWWGGGSVLLSLLHLRPPTSCSCVISPASAEGSAVSSDPTSDLCLYACGCLLFAHDPIPATSPAGRGVDWLRELTAEFQRDEPVGSEFVAKQERKKKR